MEINVSDPEEVEGTDILEPVLGPLGTPALAGSLARPLLDARVLESAAIDEEEVEAKRVANLPSINLSPETVVAGMAQEPEPPSIFLSPMAPDLPSSAGVAAERTELSSSPALGDQACRPDAPLTQVLGEVNFLDVVVAQLRGYLRFVREEFERETAQHTRVAIAALWEEN
ncbi:hypothetical protein Nepgr_011623 [Nepenthes gracilis]|uniref:Uncharacterized protein n=1 Tax=Nepenthes gracilis TaxID=150966 RepID=A0AAD3SFU3_NEPGR|nr:hypothetical protein Nepgr_011623 [Nepenthes gracilis]